MRNLSLVEKKGTLIRHKTIKNSIVKIIGTDYDCFMVVDELEISPFPLKLLFKNISQWEVIE